MKLPPQLQHFLNSPQLQQALAVIVGLLLATGLLGTFIAGGSSDSEGSSNNGSSSVGIRICSGVRVQLVLPVHL